MTDPETVSWVEDYNSNAVWCRLLVEQLGCDGVGGQLAWYNPATKAEQWLFKTGAGAAVAYNDPQNAAS